MSDTKIQWHPGFVAAMNLELAENRIDFTYEKEHNLSTKPLEIDLLVSIRANRQIVDELRGGDGMCKALLEIMEPEIEKIRADDARNLIIRSVKSFRDLGVDDGKIKEILVKNYELSPNDAATYL